MLYYYYYYYYLPIFYRFRDITTYWSKMFVFSRRFYSSQSCLNFMKLVQGVLLDCDIKLLKTTFCVLPADENYVIL